MAIYAAGSNWGGTEICESMKDLIPYIVGYGFAIVVGHFAISRLVDQLWISIGARRKHWQEDRPDEWWLPTIVGLVERALYVGFLNVHCPELIGVWLVLKVANKWYAWKDDLKEGKRTLKGSSIFSIFLIGNGLSIGYAMVGFHLVSEWKNSDLQRSLTVLFVMALLILVATRCLGCFMKKHKKKVQKDAA